MRDWLILSSVDLPPPQPKRPRMSEIVERVAARFGVPARLLTSESRRRRYTRPRQIAYWLGLLDGTRSTTMVGRYFSRDHTSIIHGRDCVDQSIADGETFGEIATEMAKVLNLPSKPLVESGDELRHVKQRGAPEGEPEIGRAI